MAITRTQFASFIAACDASRTPDICTRLATGDQLCDREAVANLRDMLASMTDGEIASDEAQGSIRECLAGWKETATFYKDAALLAAIDAI